jgi:hypothetical protein
MFALWPFESYEDILGQNHEVLLKNRRILKKMYNHVIFTIILNPNEFSYDKCHGLPSLMSQTRFVYFIGHLGAKIKDFFFFFFFVYKNL